MNYSQLFLSMVCATASMAFVGGCAPFQTESNWGPAHKLSGLGATYAWKQGAKCEPDSSKAEHPDIEARIHERIDADFAAKGYCRADGAKPDVYVCYRLGKVVTQAETGHASWDDAVLEVDLSDPATGGLVWRGRARGRIDYAASPDARKGRLETAVRQLMQPLPQAGSH
jgi:hypothetical protein